MQKVTVKSFQNNSIYEDVLAVIQADKEFSTSKLPWKETFKDNQDRECASFQVQVHYDIVVKEKTLRETMFTQIVCKEGVLDKAEKLKLKPGDCIKFTGKYSVRKGHVRWFPKFEILHPDFIEKVKSLPTDAI